MFILDWCKCVNKMEVFKLILVSMCKLISIIIYYLLRCFIYKLILGINCHCINTKLFIYQRINQFVDDCKNIDQAMNRIVEFVSLTTLTITSDLDQYAFGVLPGARIVKVLAYRIMLLLTILRFSVSALMNDRGVSALMADANHVFGNRQLISIFVTTLSISFFAVTIVSTYQELNNKFPVFDLFINYKRKGIPQLNQSNARRLASRINLMEKLLFYTTFWFLNGIVHLVVTWMTFQAYWNNQDARIVTCLIIWSVLMFFAFIQLCAVAFGGVVLSSFCALYLTFKFNEVTHKIHLSIIFNDINMLIRAIEEHHLIAKQTKQLNQFFGPILFILYFMNTPPLVILIYLFNHAQTTHIGTIIVSIIFTFLFLCTCLTNWLCCRISHSARDPYPLLNNILSNSNNISIANLLKIQAFIEKLSGPAIGFKCGPAFSMTKLQFSQYISYIIGNYIIFLNFHLNFK